MAIPTIISLGGSLIAPAGVAVDFLKSFRRLLIQRLAANSSTRFILVCGGGAPAREYQRAYFAICGTDNPKDADRIGIAATRLNAELIRHLFKPYCQEEIVTDPSGLASFEGQILVAAGWQPGFSTDYIAVCLAKRFQTELIINLSNIHKVYTQDPRLNPQARPLDEISWSDFQKITQANWTPGQNTPFDPVASREAAHMGLKVIIACGTELSNFESILDGKGFVGTLIHP